MSPRPSFFEIISPADPALIQPPTFTVKAEMRKFILFLLLLALGIAGWIAYTLYAPYRGFEAPGVFVDIPKGASERSIARLLASQGAVRNEWTFLLLCRYHSRRRPEAGEYYFTSPESAFQVFDTLAAGKVYEISVTIPEGFNSFQIGSLLEEKGFTTRDEFVEATHNTSNIRDIAPGAPTVEGFLFPATYQFPRHVTPQQIISAMTDHFRQEWSALAAANPVTDGRTTLQIVTLASLVESETPKVEERPIIAGVFMNRLRRNMPLGCDPTVVYALEKVGHYSGILTVADLRVDSPYNTYRFAGLPPGPIANPGDTSLRAALQPAAVAYLYFVADTEGGHLFGKTLEEHNRNVARYHRLLAQKSIRSPSVPQEQKRP